MLSKKYIKTKSGIRSDRRLNPVFCRIPEIKKGQSIRPDIRCILKVYSALE
jgi:hypothetical protein